MLDFEKAYERVDWTFLENVMESLGIPAPWIDAAKPLYRNESKQPLADWKKRSKSCCATMWHNTSAVGCGAEQAFDQIKAAIRGYLWAGKIKDKTMARIS